MDDLNFDFAVLGTGLAHSVLAAALSRAGKRVCHLDPWEFYGSWWSSMTLRDFLAYVGASNSKGSASTAGHSFDFEVPAPFSAGPLKACYSPTCSGKKCYAPSCRSKSRGSWKKNWNDVLNNSRSFSIDLSPKLCLSRGQLVQLLISSNISRYLEFKGVEETLVYDGTKLQLIPCSKQGLLLNTTIPLRNKRHLSKFLQQVVQFNEGDPIPVENVSEDSTFGSLVQAALPSADLQGYVIYAMANVSPNVSWREGLQRTKVFLQSLGVHGPSPFIAPMFGVGEVVQAFCRLCAVYGGVYMLGTDGTPVHDDSNTLKGVSTQHGLIQAPVVIVGASPDPENVIHRAVVIADGRCGRSENASVVTFPPGTLDTDVPITALVYGTGVHSSPDNYSIIHLSANGKRGETAAVRAALTRAAKVFTLFPGDRASHDDRSNALFTAFFSMPVPAASDSTPGMHALNDFADSSVEFEAAIAAAKALFEQLLPGEPFLPAAPNPEDIVWADDDTADTAPANDEGAPEAETEGQGSEVQEVQGEAQPPAGEGQAAAPEESSA